MRFHLFSLYVFALLVLSGCATYDVTSRHTGPFPTCEVHGLVMQPETVPVSSGYAGYLWDYPQIARERFPHHGRSVLNGEGRSAPKYGRHMRDFVCSDCSKAYDEFWRQPEFRKSKRG